MPNSDSHYNDTYVNSNNSSDADNRAAGNNEYEPVIPLPSPGPDSWVPDRPGSNNFRPNRPQCPSCPGSGSTVVWPVFPSFPSFPSISPQNYGQVRFLNASTNSMTVNISIDGTAYAANSRFAGLTDYDWISDGFHTVTVRNAAGLRTTLLQQTFPFSAGQKVTMVLTDAADGGLELIRVIDTGCSNLPANSGCFRFANMTYSGSNLDLMLGNETVFRNVSYQSVTSYKQAVAGNYEFTAVTASSFSFMRELPIIIIGNVGSSITGRQNVLTFRATITARNNFTAYLIGNTWSNANLQAIIAQD